MSQHGFEQPSAQPVDPRQVGFQLFKQGQEQQEAAPSPQARPGMRFTGGSRAAATEADRLRVSPLEPTVTPDAPVPMPQGSLERAKSVAVELAAEGVAARVQARLGNLNRAPTTEASINQLSDLGMSNEELTILRGAGVL